MRLSRKRLDELVTKWREVLNITPQWAITSLIRRTPRQMSSGNTDAAACIDVSLSYLTATIEFNEKLINSDDIDRIVVHELLHIVVEPLGSLAYQVMGKRFEQTAKNAEESLIEHLAAIILRSHND